MNNTASKGVMPMNNVSRIQHPCDANGISGFEDQVLLTFRNEAAKLGTFTENSMRDLSPRGIPTIVIGVPVRYARTKWGISSLEDVQNAGKLGAQVIKAPDKKTLPGI